MKSPVVIFAYRRVDTLKRCIESLSLCEYASETPVYIYSDGSKSENDRADVAEVRAFLTQYRATNMFGQFQIFFREKNYGLSNNIILGVTEILEIYSRIIVLEDDLIVSEDFLKFMNDCLDYYENSDSVGAIGGFGPYLNILELNKVGLYTASQGCSCGWATWKAQWDRTDWSIEYAAKLLSDEKFRQEFESIQYGIVKILDGYVRGNTDSWAIRWDASLFVRGLKTVYPQKSKVENCGFTEKATNTNSIIDKRSHIRAQVSDYNLLPAAILSDYTYYVRKANKPSLLERIIWRIHNGKSR